MISTIIFDVDGTLYDETNAKIKAELLTAEYLSRIANISVEELYQKFFESKNYIMNKYRGTHLSIDRKLWFEEMLKRISVDTIIADKLGEYYWNVVLDNIEPYADLLAILPRLADQYKLYVLTDELHDIQKVKLKHLGLDGYFMDVISSDLIGAVKPRKAIFDYVLEVIGESPDKIVMIGDNPSADIVGGNLAGMHTIWLKRGKYFYYPQKVEERPKITIRNYMELENHIRSL